MQVSLADRCLPACLSVVLVGGGCRDPDFDKSAKDTLALELTVPENSTRFTINVCKGPLDADQRLSLSPPDIVLHINPRKSYRRGTVTSKTKRPVSQAVAHAFSSSSCCLVKHGLSRRMLSGHEDGSLTRSRGLCVCLAGWLLQGWVVGGREAQVQAAVRAAHRVQQQQGEHHHHAAHTDSAPQGTNDTGGGLLLLCRGRLAGVWQACMRD